jgi:periplasmic protein CpxP/Spy
MAKNKILLFIIAILLVTNIAMLFFFMRMKPSENQSKKLGFTEKLKDQVGFTQQQMAVFEPKKKIFWTHVRERSAALKKTKEQFYQFMYDPTVPDSVIQAKADVIGEQQRDLDLYVIKHFKDIRTLCTPEQLPKFDSLLPPLIERMTARPSGRK